MDSPPDIREIDFGLASAENERTERPKLLLEGYLDSYGYVDRIRRGHEFVILGQKGSGKSAIASRIQLLADLDEAGPFVRQFYLTSFPFSTFSEILPGPDAPTTKFVNNWQFLLYVALLDSFRRDSHCKISGKPTLSDVLELLADLGLSPARDLTFLVREASTREFRAKIPQVFEFRSSREKEKRQPDIRLLFATLQEACQRSQPSKEHLIFVDGLDEVQLNRERDQFALSALILAADRLNRQLGESGVRAKIVVLCRTDIFERLPGSNQNIIRQDRAITLHWFQEGVNPTETNLVQLVNHRARVSLHRPVDVFRDLLPETVFGRPTTNVVLDHTRHLPRDMVQLMNRIKEHSHAPTATEENVKAALRRYSDDYLVPEIRDEVSNLPGSEGASETLQVISMLGKKRFMLEELESFVKGDPRFKSVDFAKAVRALFECSAIGTARRNAWDDDSWMNFRYRNPNANMNLNDEMVVHAGLIRGLNVH
jgi:hypothetical protein